MSSFFLLAGVRPFAHPKAPDSRLTFLPLRHRIPQIRRKFSREGSLPMPDMYFLVHPEQSARLGSPNGVRIREDTVYTNHKGQEKKGVRKRADKALDKLQEILRKALGPEEAVLYIARCQAPASAFEQLTFGWYIYYVTATMLVFTNRRLLLFQLKRDGSWKKILRAVVWGDVEGAEVKGWLSRTLRIKYRNGKKETYWGLGGGDARKIKVLLEALFSRGALESSAAGGIVPLCPHCLAELTPQLYECPHCKLTFKDEKTMVRRSLLIPGGGYFYVGYWFLGIMDFVVEAYLLILLVVFVLAAVSLTVGSPSGQAAGASGEAWGVAIFVGLILAVEKWLTIHHCRRFIREFIPKE
jgi:hypothetical protein